MAEALVGIIGGSGLYEMEHLVDVDEVVVDTPFGPASDQYAVGRIGGVGVAFLPRHGRGHRIAPSELPTRANLFGFKTLGVEYLISISAVGSLQQPIAPTHLVVPDQLIDRTRNRVDTFFGDGLVVHVALADPYCRDLSRLVADAARATGTPTHEGGTLVVIEGPQFSTRAESFLYRGWGASIIGMTALPEARLAREAEMCYATLACVTDYDVWHESHGDVSVEMIVANLLHNVAASKAIVRDVVLALGDVPRACSCSQALQHAIITAPEAIPGRIKYELAPLIGKYLPHD